MNQHRLTCSIKRCSISSSKNDVWYATMNGCFSLDKILQGTFQCVMTTFARKEMLYEHVC